MPVLGICLLGQVLGVAPCGSDRAAADRDPFKGEAGVSVTACVQLATWHHCFIMERGAVAL